MSEAAAPATPEAAGNESQKPAKRSGMLTKVIALVFMLTVVVTECLVGYVWFFSPSDAAVAAHEAGAEEGDHASEHAAKPKDDAHGHGGGEHAAKPAAHAAHGSSDSQHGGHGEHAEAGAKGPATHGEYAEVDLGKYNVMAYQPGANSMRVIEFHLYGAIASEDHAAFERLWEANQQRCRDQVIVTIRSSDVEDFTDPSLGLIKRKILARTNDVLGKPLIEEVVFSDFSFIEE